MIDREELIKGFFLMLFGLLLMFLGVSLIIYGLHDVQGIQPSEGMSGLIMISNWCSTFGVILLGAGVLTIICGMGIWSHAYYDGIEFMEGVKIKW